MRFSNRDVFPALLFAGLKGHIFLSVPLLFYVLSTIDGRIVFYLLLGSFQGYVCTLVGVAMFIREAVVSRLVVFLLRLFSVFCWGGICFLVYALIGSVLYTRFHYEPPVPKNRVTTVAAVFERHVRPLHFSAELVALPKKRI